MNQIEQLRQEQAARVMPLVGALLDAYDSLPGDLRADLAENAVSFVHSIYALSLAVEPDDSDSVDDVLADSQNDAALLVCDDFVIPKYKYPPSVEWTSFLGVRVMDVNERKLHDDLMAMFPKRGATVCAGLNVQEDSPEANAATRERANVTEQAPISSSGMPSRFPSIFQRAAWRGVTPVDANTQEIGLSFTVQKDGTDQVMYFRLPVDGARGFAESMLNYLQSYLDGRDHSEASSGKPSVDVSMPEECDRVCPPARSSTA